MVIASNRIKRRLAGLVADAVDADPTLLDDARDRLRDQLAGSMYRARWEQLIDAGVEAVTAALRGQPTYDDGLLSDNPFALLGLIDEDVRLKIIAEEHRHDTS
jgi:hypothetical protein